MTDTETTPAAGVERGWVGRVVLYGLPLLLVLCALLSVNYWPFTSAELFSRVRTSAMRETQVRGDLPDGTTVVIDETTRLSFTAVLPQRKIDAELCDLWAQAGEDQQGQPVTNVRAYRMSYEAVRTDDDVERRLLSEKPAWTCAP